METILLESQVMKSRRASDRARGIVNRVRRGVMTTEEKVTGEMQALWAGYGQGGGSGG